MNMILNRQTLIDIVELMTRFPDADYVDIEVDSSSGIGSIVTAEIPITLNEVNGKFKTTLMDESDW